MPLKRKVRFESIDSESSLGSLTSTESLSIHSIDLNNSSNNNDSGDKEISIGLQDLPRKHTFEEEIEGLIHNYE